MGTIASDVWRNYMTASCSLPDYPSAVFSGIVSDEPHKRRNTYHSGIEDLPNQTGYTNTHPDDKAPPGTWPRNLASAGDKSMNTADMVKEWKRYEAVYNNHADPRRKFIAEYQGWNGRGEAERLDFQKNTRTVTTSDHKWHSHRAGRRRYANDRELGNALLSIEKGETPEQYLANVEDDDMFCNKGDTNGKVGVLQRKINEILAEEFPGSTLLVIDYEYGRKTADALMQIGCGNPQNNGEVYWEGEDYLLGVKIDMSRARRAVSGGIGNHTHELTFDIDIPAITVTTQ